MKNKVNENQFQQGDVLIERIESLPKDVVPVNTTVLAEGEETGHMHCVSSEKGDAQILEYADKRKREEAEEKGEEYMFINADSGFVVKHNKHNPIDLTDNIKKFGAGLFSVRKVRIFDYLENEERAAQD